MQLSADVTAAFDTSINALEEHVSSIFEQSSVPGVAVAIFSATTQIQEQSLSFVPKMIAAVAVLVLGGHWIMTTLIEYIQRLLQSIPSMVS